MEAHPTDAVLQGEACGALGNLAADERNQVEVSSTGGVSAVVAAMREHKDSAGVQEKACGALGNFTAGNAENQLIVTREGGIDLVLEAMALHRKKAKVQQNASTVLQILASNFVRCMKKAQWVCDILPNHSSQDLDTPDAKRQRTSIG